MQVEASSGLLLLLLLAISSHYLCSLVARGYRLLFVMFHSTVGIAPEVLSQRLPFPSPCRLRERFTLTVYRGLLGQDLYTILEFNPPYDILISSISPLL